MIIEAEVCLDHIHMLLEIPPKYSVSSVLGFLKGKSSIIANGAIWNISIEIESLGVEAIM